jgi:AAA domain
MLTSKNPQATTKPILVVEPWRKKQQEDWRREQEQKRAEITRIQRENGLDREHAEWLYSYRHNTWLDYHKQFWCEKFEERLATAAADRALGNRDDGASIDWNSYDRQRRQKQNGSGTTSARGSGHASEAPTAQPQQATASGNLNEWDAGKDPGPILPREWLLANQFCRGFISSIVAPGGGGKTALRLLQLISLALGRPLSGQHVFHRCRALVVSLEEDRDELQRRIQAVLNHYGIDRSELNGWLFCASPKLAKLAVMQNKTRAIGPLEHQIREAIERRKPDIVSLDPFIKTHGLEENDSGDMDFVCDVLAQLAVEFNIAVDAPHHVRKGEITPGDPDSGRGSSGIRDAAWLVYTLAPMSEAEAKAFNIDPDDRHLYVRLDPAKVNIAARAGKATWFRMVPVAIGNGTPEYPSGDTIQVLEPWSPPETWAGLDNEIINKILNVIDAGIAGGNFYTDAAKAPGREAWQVVQQFAPEKSEAQAREIIRIWVKTGLLVPFPYPNPVTRKDVRGLKVDSTKRPG